MTFSMSSPVLALPIDDLVHWAWNHHQWPSWEASDPEERLLGATVFFLEAAGRPFPAVHETLLAPLLDSIGPWPIQAWLEKLSRYAFWVDAHHRLPSLDGDDDEIRWSAWAKAEASLAAQSATRRHEIAIRAPYLLDPAQAPDVAEKARVALEQAEERERQRLESRWRDRLSAYVAWTSLHERRPSAASDDATEASLARWLRDQRPRNLTSARAQLLDQHVPLRSGRPRAFVVQAG